MSEILEEILVKLKNGPTGIPSDDSRPVSSAINLVPMPLLFAYANSLEKSMISAESFASFAREVHNHLIRLDSARRASLFRLIRYCLQSSQHVKVLVQEELHWIIISSLEKDSSSEFNVERIQALKVMDKIRKVSPEFFPLGFARSIVSIANSKDDNLRKLSLDLLRELSIVNPQLVAAVGGFTTLMESILDPISPECADKVLHTILFMLNDPAARKIISPCIDLKFIVSRFIFIA
jgi:hypothetical protein